MKLTNEYININAQKGSVETVLLNGRRFDCGSIELNRASNYEFCSDPILGSTSHKFQSIHLAEIGIL